MTQWNEMVLTIKKGLGIESPARGGVLSESPALLPVQRMDGRILTSSKQVRCTLEEKEFINHGRYGLIQMCIRKPGDRRLVIKRPKRPHLSQITEAIVQQAVYKCFAARDLHGAVPEVVDLYMFAHEERFTMECIDGESLENYLKSYALSHGRVEVSAHFLDLIVQLAILLYVLETDMKLDHRDLSPTNIWVRSARTPFTYILHLADGTRIQYESTVQLVLLDFGFCCLGAGPSVEPVSLGGVIPLLDPCPKDGRDMLTLLNRLYNIPIVRQSLTLDTVALFQTWCHPQLLGEDAYRTLLDTSEPEFKLPLLEPSAILKWWVQPRLAAVVPP